MKKISILLFVLSLLFITSCKHKKEVKNDEFFQPSETPGISLYYEMNKNGKDTYLPRDAVITKELGNGWVTFTLDDHEYLFFLIKSGNRSYSSVTLIK